MIPRQKIAVVGPGRLGGTLARALGAAGGNITRLGSRDPKSLRQSIPRGVLDAVRIVSPQEAVDAAHLIFVTVPDDALGRLAAGLRFRRGQRVVHCSGALELSTLEPARAQGALAGCLHPLQAFPSPFDTPTRFSGIVCGVEGEAELADELNELCRAMGASDVSLAGVDRALYHAAAVLSSNYVVALLAAAARVWEQAGLPRERAQQALLPLALGATHNLGDQPFERSLTGPLVRGDVDTLRKHLSAFSAAPDLAALYRALGAELLRLPLPLSPTQRQALEAIVADRASSA